MHASPSHDTATIDAAAEQFEAPVALVDAGIDASSDGDAGVNCVARPATRRAIYRAPLRPGNQYEHPVAWLAPGTVVRIVQPGSDHFDGMRQFVLERAASSIANEYAFFRASELADRCPRLFVEAADNAACIARCRARTWPEFVAFLEECYQLHVPHHTDTEYAHCPFAADHSPQDRYVYECARRACLISSALGQTGWLEHAGPTDGGMYFEEPDLDRYEYLRWRRIGVRVTRYDHRIRVWP